MLCPTRRRRRSWGRSWRRMASPSSPASAPRRSARSCRRVDTQPYAECVCVCVCPCVGVELPVLSDNCWQRTCALLKRPLAALASSLSPQPSAPFIAFLRYLPLLPPPPPPSPFRVLRLPSLTVVLCSPGPARRRSGGGPGHLCACRTRQHPRRRDEGACVRVSMCMRVHVRV